MSDSSSNELRDFTYSLEDDLNRLLFKDALFYEYYRPKPRTPKGYWHHIRRLIGNETDGGNLKPDIARQIDIKTMQTEFGKNTVKVVCTLQPRDLPPAYSCEEAEPGFVAASKRHQIQPAARCLTYEDDVVAIKKMVGDHTILGLTSLPELDIHPGMICDVRDSQAREFLETPGDVCVDLMDLKSQYNDLSFYQIRPSNFLLGRQALDMIGRTVYGDKKRLLDLTDMQKRARKFAKNLPRTQTVH